MEIMIICKNENYDNYKMLLEKAGFKVVAEAGLVFKETDYQPQTFVGKKDNLYEQINPNDVYLIESFGRDIYLYTLTDTYQIKQKLYEIEAEYQYFGFIRINKSQIINKNYISKIKPLINSRIKIILSNNKILEISRNYQENFREIIGF